MWLISPDRRCRQANCSLEDMYILMSHSSAVHVFRLILSLKYIDQVPMQR